MTNYAGWSMPLYYTSILEECLACRQSSVIFDVSHMLQSKVTNVESKFHTQLPDKPWQSKLCLWLNEAGGIEDDVILTRTTSDAWRMVSNAATRDKVLKAFNAQEERAVLLALQGPEAEGVLTKLGFEVASLPFMHSAQHQGILITRCGYTGEDGFELSISNLEQAEQVASSLSNHSRWAGLGARDILRIEAGLRLYGHEMRPDLTPADAGLGWLVHEEQWKGREKARFKLQGWRTTGRMVRSNGMLITSSCWSPHLQCPIGMALIPRNDDEHEMRLEDGRVLEAVKMPFIPHRFKKNI